MSEATLAPEVITTFFGFKVTNTFLSTLLVDLLLITLIFFIRTRFSLIPNTLQNITEVTIDTLYSLNEQISGKFTKSIFPWFASFFIFIFIANILGLLPGFGSIGFFHEEHGRMAFVPIFRGLTSDLNATLALAIVSLVATHVLSIKYNGLINYLKRFISINPVFLFVGLLEIVSEITKIISLSFRLFGNIYAGEVVLTTIAGLFAFVVPIPFLILEGIVAFVQALVFSMLTMVFMSILIVPHHQGGE